MKRKQEAEVRKALEEQQQRVIDESHWVLPVQQSVQKYVCAALLGGLLCSRVVWVDFYALACSTD